MRYVAPTTAFVLSVLGAAAQNCDRPGQIPCDVQIGTPVATSFSRAFPLLDGLYQDLAAMQVAPLNVSPNGINAASLDAVLQQFQANLQYSATLGVQNSLAAQQANTASANIALQNSLVGFEQQLYIQLQAAQKDQLAKHQALDQLASDDPGRPAALLASNQADDTVTQLQNQINTVKGLITISAPGATSFTAPVPGSSGSVPVPTIQSGTPTPALQTGTNFVPSFPAYKQMEVQAALLRERLAKLVSVLSQQAHYANQNLYLVEFHASPLAGKPGVFHKHRKGKMLSVEYVLQGCSDKGGATVVDLFPRNSAINISNEKYRDSRLGINFIMSLFSFGLNSAYNREHLQISQSLSEAAYITGFGITRSHFGWTYGLALGEDTLAPGDRESFALVAVPTGCSPVVSLARAFWSKDPPQDSNDVPSPILAADHQTPLIFSPLDGKADASSKLVVKSVSYNPIQYDPTDKTAKPAVVVNFEFDASSQIDSQAVLTVNGALIKRARDNFFRGTTVPSGGNTFGGLLETASFDPDTWIPLGPNRIAVNLNVTELPNRNGFPNIQMSVPGQPPLDLTAQIGVDDKFTLTIGGQAVQCADRPCAPLLPALGLPKPTGTPKTINVSRYWASGTRPNAGKTMLSITADEPPSQPQAPPAGVKVGQVIAASETQKWDSPSVLAQKGTDRFALHCTASGGRLECPFPAQLDVTADIVVAVTDLNYSGGPVIGSGDLPACDAPTCYPPLVRHLEDPVWTEANGGEWLLRMSLDNVRAGKLELYDTFDNSQKTLLSTSKLHCVPDGPWQSCDAVFEITPTQFPALTDDMSIGFAPGAAAPTATAPNGSARLFFLRQLLQPVLTQFKPAADNSSISMAGKNLFFQNVRVGSSKAGATLPADCPAGVACSVTGGSKDLAGYAYFCADAGCGTVFPLLLADDKGVLAPAWLDKSGPDKKGTTPTLTPFLKPGTFTPADNNARGSRVTHLMAAQNK